MTRLIAAGTMLLALLGMTASAAPAAAAAKEQIVFSGEGDGSFEVGFWVWCAVDEAGAYDDCSGALRFDDLQIVKHVEGEVSETGEDVYRMDVWSRDGSVACSLTNGTPITHGPSNTVWIDCASPEGTAMSEDAVVVATG
jgi:hypothetical protein